MKKQIIGISIRPEHKERVVSGELIKYFPPPGLYSVIHWGPCDDENEDEE